MQGLTVPNLTWPDSCSPESSSLFLFFTRIVPVPQRITMQARRGRGLNRRAVQTPALDGVSSEPHAPIALLQTLVPIG
jgi:hypothetical protein